VSGLGFFLILLFEALVIGSLMLLMLLYPRIARRGLLFGVYVGEERWDSPEARRIVRGWQAAVVVWTLASIGIVSALFQVFRTPFFMGMAVLFVAVSGMGLYLWAYFRARALAVPGPPPPAVAALARSEGTPLLPFFILAACVLCAVFAFVYCAARYSDLPARVPTHFGPSGHPDAWRPKSFWTVMLMPLMTLIIGTGMGGVVYFTATAKRAPRYPQLQVSAEAQLKFRRAVTRFLSAISIVVTVMMTMISVGSVRVGLGLATNLSPWTMGITVVLVVLALGGTLWLALHYGQGGARLERSAGNAPLTDGLADNRNWVLGVFYVNRDDPSIFVKRRFGFGYTINFGNWKAVAFLAAFIGLILLVTVMALIKN
jgi:uncharacterized membrane protein